MYQKLKSLIENELFFVSILLILVALTSFFLGRASVVIPERSQIAPVSLVGTDTKPLTVDTESKNIEVVDSASVEAKPNTAQYVASKSGSKYHLVTCPGAKQIKTENKVFFNSSSEAEAAGYSKAANCPGL